MSYDLALYVYFFSNFYLSVYVFAAITLLIGASFLKDKFKTEAYNLLYVFNTLAAWCSLSILIYFAGDLFMAWYGKNSNELYYFKPEATTYWTALYYLKMYSPPLVGLLLFFRKLRISRVYTLFFLFFLSAGIMGKLVDSFGDYLPSSWSAYQESSMEKFIKYATVFLLLGVIYFIAKKRNKLPHSSVFLK